MSNILIKNPLTKETMQPNLPTMPGSPYPSSLPVLPVSGMGSAYPREMILTQPMGACRDLVREGSCVFSREHRGTSWTSTPDLQAQGHYCWQEVGGTRV